MAELPESVRPRQLALRYARLANRLCKVWTEPAKCERLLDDLMIDRRGPARAFRCRSPTSSRRCASTTSRLHHHGKSAWEHVEMGR